MITARTPRTPSHAKSAADPRRRGGPQSLPSPAMRSVRAGLLRPDAPRRQRRLSARPSASLRLCVDLRASLRPWSLGGERGIVLPLVLVVVVLLLGFGLLFQGRYRESSHLLVAHQDQIRLVYLAESGFADAVARLAEAPPPDRWYAASGQATWDVPDFEVDGEARGGYQVFLRDGPVDSNGVPEFVNVVTMSRWNRRVLKTRLHFGRVRFVPLADGSGGHLMVVTEKQLVSPATLVRDFGLVRNILARIPGNPHLRDGGVQLPEVLEEGPRVVRRLQRGERIDLAEGDSLPGRVLTAVVSQLIDVEKHRRLRRSRAEAEVEDETRTVVRAATLEDGPAAGAQLAERLRAMKPPDLPIREDVELYTRPEMEETLIELALQQLARLFEEDPRLSLDLDPATVSRATAELGIEPPGLQSGERATRLLPFLRRLRRRSRPGSLGQFRGLLRALGIRVRMRTPGGARRQVALEDVLEHLDALLRPRVTEGFVRRQVARAPGRDGQTGDGDDDGAGDLEDEDEGDEGGDHRNGGNDDLGEDGDGRAGRGEDGPRLAVEPDPEALEIFDREGLLDDDGRLTVPYEEALSRVLGENNPNLERLQSIPGLAMERQAMLETALMLQEILEELPLETADGMLREDRGPARDAVDRFLSGEPPQSERPVAQYVEDVLLRSKLEGDNSRIGQGESFLGTVFGPIYDRIKDIHAPPYRPTTAREFIRQVADRTGAAAARDPDSPGRELYNMTGRLLFGEEPARISYTDRDSGETRYLGDWLERRLDSWQSLRDTAPGGGS